MFNLASNLNDNDLQKYDSLRIKKIKKLKINYETINLYEGTFSNYENGYQLSLYDDELKSFLTTLSTDEFVETCKWYNYKLTKSGTGVKLTFD